MATYSTGEHRRTLQARVLKMLENLKDDFMMAIPNAPQKAITADGVKTNLIKRIVKAEIDRNTAYTDADVHKLSIEKAFEPWHDISCPPFSLDKDEIRDSAIAKESEIRTQLRDAVQESYRDYTLHTIAPDDSSNASFPVLRTTGADDGTGRRRLTLTDLITYGNMWRALNLPAKSRVNGVLSLNHLLDLQLDTEAKQAFKEFYHRRSDGEPMSIYGFDWYWNASHLTYDLTGNKKAQGAAAAVGDQDASTFFWGPATQKALGGVSIQHTPKEQDTRNVPPQDETNIHGYVYADKIRKAGTGVIISANVYTK